MLGSLLHHEVLDVLHIPPTGQAAANRASQECSALLGIADNSLRTGLDSVYQLGARSVESLDGSVHRSAFFLGLTKEARNPARELVRRLTDLIFVSEECFKSNPVVNHSVSGQDAVVSELKATKSYFQPLVRGVIREQVR